jgi:hypothetical protein
MMHGRLGVNVGAPYLEGQAGKIGRAARASSVAGATIAMSLGRRRRGAAVLGGTLLLAGSALTRFSVYRAGFESARDPYAIVGPRPRVLEAG